MLFDLGGADVASGKESIRVKSTIGFFASGCYRNGRLQTAMRVHDGIDVFGEQFKVFLRHTVAPVVYYN
jgi:hypothetical protein